MNPFELMKMMGSLQSQTKRIKEEISALRATGSAGAGLVEATVNGDFQLMDLNISEAAYSLGDKENLKVLIISAVNDAANKAKAEVERKTQDILMNLSP